MTYQVKAKVLRFDGYAAWHYAEIPKQIYTEMLGESLVFKRGFGSIPVRVTLGDTVWETSIFPIGGGKYMIAIKAMVRKKENISEGEQITILFEPR